MTEKDNSSKFSAGDESTIASISMPKPQGKSRRAEATPAYPTPPSSTGLRVVALADLRPSDSRESLETSNAYVRLLEEESVRSQNSSKKKKKKKNLKTQQADSLYVIKETNSTEVNEEMSRNTREINDVKDTQDTGDIRDRRGSSTNPAVYSVESITSADREGFPSPPVTHSRTSRSPSRSMKHSPVSTQYSTAQSSTLSSKFTQSTLQTTTPVPHIVERNQTQKSPSENVLPLPSYKVTRRSAQPRISESSSLHIWTRPPPTASIYSGTTDQETSEYTDMTVTRQLHTPRESRLFTAEDGAVHDLVEGSVVVFEDQVVWPVPVNQILLCNICGGIDLVAVFSGCGSPHLFCHDCIMDCLKRKKLCPLCQQYTDKHLVTPASSSIRQEIRTLTISCMACDQKWTGKFSEYPSHILECNGHTKCCRFKDEGCTAEFQTSAELNKHEKEEADFHLALLLNYTRTLGLENSILTRRTHELSDQIEAQERAARSGPLSSVAESAESSPQIVEKNSSSLSGVALGRISVCSPLFTTIGKGSLEDGGKSERFILEDIHEPTVTISGTLPKSYTKLSEYSSFYMHPSEASPCVMIVGGRTGNIPSASIFAKWWRRPGKVFQLPKLTIARLWPAVCAWKSYLFIFGGLLVDNRGNLDAPCLSFEYIPTKVLEDTLKNQSNRIDESQSWTLRPLPSFMRHVVEVQCAHGLIYVLYESGSSYDLNQLDYSNCATNPPSTWFAEAVRVVSQSDGEIGRVLTAPLERSNSNLNRTFTKSSIRSASSTLRSSVTEESSDSSVESEKNSPCCAPFARKKKAPAPKKKTVETQTSRLSMTSASTTSEKIRDTLTRRIVTLDASKGLQKEKKLTWTEVPTEPCKQLLQLSLFDETLALLCANDLDHTLGVQVFSHEFNQFVFVDDEAGKYFINRFVCTRKFQRAKNFEDVLAMHRLLPRGAQCGIVTS